ncbi:acyl-CoA thioesterase [Actinomadura violacea]|uniref:Acyl-CoA thioesterase n=1 Tax=Actinomadura violacea TaxID=2819934 RepID=A0ABS3RLM5_9ACTN|nr:acyl-CoA thioesterase [Actinomadura violacea]MBO2457640.1 acyl-CoA thioesterase [Actinomadura violacea]
MSAEPLHAVSFRLSYGDCDPAGIVYYANYQRWMERTHTEWWYLRGLRFDELPARLGVAVVTRASTAEYERTITLFDVVECRLFAERLGRTSFAVRGDFVTEDGDRACTAALTLVCVDAADPRRTVPVPEPMRLALGAGNAALSG